jgi:hypothetical protein
MDDKAAFAWWVSDVFKKREPILAKVKAKFWQWTHKFGIGSPKMVAQAQAIDKGNCNTMWWDVILMEMKNACPAFEKWEKTETKIPMAINILMEMPFYV